jgi:hypothetical protein
MGLEGIVSKRLTAPYRSGPSRDLAQNQEPGQPRHGATSGGDLVSAFTCPLRLMRFQSQNAAALWMSGAFRAW